MRDQNHSQRTKLVLDSRVAAQLGMDRKSVSLITKLFIEAARETLVEEGTVALPRLGQVTVTKVKRKKMFELASKHNPDVKYKRYVDAYFAVSFSMSPLLKKELKKNGKARSR